MQDDDRHAATSAERARAQRRPVAGSRPSCRRASGRVEDLGVPSAHPSSALAARLRDEDEPGDDHDHEGEHGGDRGAVADLRLVEEVRYE